MENKEQENEGPNLANSHFYILDPWIRLDAFLLISLFRQSISWVSLILLFTQTIKHIFIFIHHKVAVKEK